MKRPYVLLIVTKSVISRDTEMTVSREKTLFVTVEKWTLRL